MNPLTSETAKVNELVKALNRAACSTIVDDEPTEPIRDSLRPLNWDVTIERVPDRVLKSEECSVKVEDEPTVPVRSSTCPLDTVVERPIEPASDLPNPFVSEPASESEPIRVFANPLV